jgi:hypothetical protein
MIGKRGALIDDDRVVGETFELCPFLHQPSNMLAVDYMNQRLLAHLLAHRLAEQLAGSGPDQRVGHPERVPPLGQFGRPRLDRYPQRGHDQRPLGLTVRKEVVEHGEHHARFAQAHIDKQRRFGRLQQNCTSLSADSRVAARGRAVPPPAAPGTLSGASRDAEYFACFLVSICPRYFQSEYLPQFIVPL